MSPLLDPDESAALSAAVRTAVGRSRISVVTPRDFKEPRTLSADRIGRIEKMLSSRLQSIANALAGPLRGHPSLTLGSVCEVNAQGLFDGFVKPFIVHGFECDGYQGWLIWDARAARLACDTVLSGDSAEAQDPDDEALVLSRTERRVVASLLDEMIARIATQFGLDVRPGTVWQEPEEVTTMEDLGPDADSRRLHVHLGFESPGGDTSDVRIYLPGMIAREEQTDASEHQEAPLHLTGIEIEVSAILGGADVPLEDLLQIEVGDVIPLDTRVGEPIDLEIEEIACARGRFGARGGRFAVLVDEVGTLPSSNSSSELDSPRP